jgi:hypothetical protein
MAHVAGASAARRSDLRRFVVTFVVEQVLEAVSALYAMQLAEAPRGD